MLFGKMIINDGYAERQIKNVWKKTVRLFTNKIQEAIEAKKSRREASTAVQEVSDYEQLEKLASLASKNNSDCVVRGFTPSFTLIASMNPEARVV